MTAELPHLNSADPNLARTVLVVEDDEVMRDTLERALHLGGYETRTASTASDGLRLSREAAPDLIVCDVHLADGDGRALLSELRSQAAMEACPFIMITGDAGKECRRSSMSLGADDFLEKPFTLQELLDCVELRLKRWEGAQKSQQRLFGELRNSVKRSLPHEFLTPLHGIIGLARLLENEAPKAEEVAEIAATISGCGEQLLRSITNYLTILELNEESPSTTEHRDELTGTQLAEETAAVARHLAQSYERADDLDIADTLGPSFSVSLSLRRWSAAIHEIIDNAFKFSPRGRKVVVKLSASQSEITLSVADFGIGISSDQIKQVGAFRQFEPSRYSQQGLGLGLTLAQKLIDKDGGVFRIESVLGAGTSASASWPL